jgi:hypothetical protein
MSRFQHTRCPICNEEVDLGEGATGTAYKWDGSGPRPRLPESYLLHDACIRRVAHPDFDFAAVVRAREERERIMETMPGENE